MIQHIRDKTCINMMTLDKDNFNKYGYSTLWDTTTYIDIYWKYLDDLAKKIDARDIATNDYQRFCRPNVGVQQLHRGDSD